MRIPARLATILSVASFLLPLNVHAQTPFPGEELTLSQRVTLALDANNLEGLRAIGPESIPAMVFLYETGDDALRTRLAHTFRDLAWVSPELESALMRDAHARSVDLRLAVLYALGRVSDDPQVVDTLLDMLQNDPNPLFRDKAACALAYDQIHLEQPGEKMHLYEGLIQALSNPHQQVQALAIQALSILTGETKGFHPAFPPEKQQRSIEMWEQWLAETRSSL